MIKIKDSLRLAQTKFKTRKLRNLFSGCTISLGIIIIMVALLGASGVISFVKKAFADPLAGRYFTVENFNAVMLEVDGQGGFGGQLPDINDEDVKKKRAEFSNSELYKNKNYGMTNIYKAYYAGFSVSIDEIKDNKMIPFSLSYVDEIFVTDLLYGDYDFKDRYNDAVPAILPKSYVLKEESGKYAYLLTAKERYEIFQNNKEKYLGKQFPLLEYRYESEPNSAPNSPPVMRTATTDLDVNIVVVGFANDSSNFSTNYLVQGNSIILPNWAIEEKEQLVAKSETSTPMMIAEFNTKEDAQAFRKTKEIKAGPPVFGTTYSPINIMQGKFESFVEVVDVIKKPVYIAGGFLLLVSALFTFTTITKIISDSKKEIGIFRAIGGQKRDIKKIFFSYTFVLTTLGFLIGITVSVIFNMIISRIWGQDLFYQIIDLGTTTDFSQPVFLLLGFPGLSVLMLYLLTLLIGLLASYIPATRAANIDPVAALREG